MAMSGLVSQSVQAKRLTVYIDLGGTGAFGLFSTQAMQDGASRALWHLPSGQPASWHSARNSRGRATRGKLKGGNVDG